MSSIIEVKNLSKSYTINHEGQERYTALRDVMASKAKKIFSFPASLRNTKQASTKEEFWALKDVSFNVEQGDRVGIIGRNGAGKSTLLKILSRITEPTQGSIKIKGKVASLLEVGTGFHPELTGRENIFLNGAILGMSRVEIKKHFDAIVDFAEIEKFLDTPVKRYSSGMYVRLAFAVAAHLEPEVLVVDEVLAVGDAEFQKKCLGKMNDISKGEGRTILFVSHNLDALRSLCNVGILLNKGKNDNYGPIDKVIEKYVSVGVRTRKVFDYKGEKPQFTMVEINEQKLMVGTIEVTIEFKSPFELNPPNIGLLIANKFGTPLFASSGKTHSIPSLKNMSQGKAVLNLTDFPLHTDTYNLSIYLGDFFMNYEVKLDLLTFEFTSSTPVINKQEVSVVGSLNLQPDWTYTGELLSTKNY